MHILIGILIIVGSFLLAVQYVSLDFDGFLNYYALILLGGVPVGLAILTYPFRTLGEALTGLFKALFTRTANDRERLTTHLLAFGRAIRSERPAEAAAILEKEKDPLFKHLGEHILQASDPEEIEIDAMIVGRRQLQKYRSGEKVFSSMGDFAPAMGMIGTVIGLIQLLANMRDFEKLGPGMAIALLTTFYGLLLAHLLYLPIARLIADRRNAKAENMNLVADVMLKVARRRPLHEIQQILGSSDRAPAGADGSSGGRVS